MSKKRDAYGGNGDIFFSDDNLTATKLLRNRSSLEKIKRFKREIEIMQMLSEKRIPNVVEVINVEIDEANIESSKIVMKKYDGCLPDLLCLTKGNVMFTLNLLLPIIQALKTLSENEPAIYHRDLKPENILYKKNEDKYELFLTDFGICYLKDDDERLTEETTAVGARMFIAPEYEIGRVENVTEKGDIFSIGKIIWWLINGNEHGLLPSNFWFVDEYDLLKRFPSTPDIVAANTIIASCLRLNPAERCDYNQLIKMINNILDESIAVEDSEKQYLVEVSVEKKRIHYLEQLRYNKQLVNMFSIFMLEAIEKIIVKYSTISFLKVMKKEYASKSADGVDYTNRNVDDNSSHYLYSKSFDDIYIPIHYNPASKGEKYANICFQYFIRSSDIQDEITVYYNEHGVVVTNYHSNVEELTKESFIVFLEDMISNYII